MRVTRWGWSRQWVVIGLVCVGVAGCADLSARTSLVNASTDEEALTEAVLGALSDRDEAALRGFLVTREEYETLLWPKLPDGEYTPFDFIWQLTANNNRKGLRQVATEYGGMHLDLVSVTFTEEPEVYDSFTLHLGAEVVVRNRETGEEGILPSFDVFVEYGGGWKLMNFDEL